MMQVRFSKGKYFIKKGRKEYVFSSYLMAKHFIEAPRVTAWDYLKSIAGGLAFAGSFYVLYLILWAIAPAGSW